MRATVDLSIVICTRNRASTLNGTLEALSRIRSRYTWEVLMIDNNSTDGTADVIKAADDCGGRLRYALCERIGLGAARDFAWRLTSGGIVAFTDDDCYPASDYVDCIVEAFAAHPEVGVLGGRILLYDPDDLPLTIDTRTEPQTYAPRQHIETGSLKGANLALRREVLERIGGFDPCLGAGTPFPSEDIDVIAATLWAGYAGRYDPAPLVYHHHRRRAQDLPGMERSYDAGRGAYYAKYLLRPDTRRYYLTAWRRRVAKRGGRKGFESFKRELTSALAYVRMRKAWCFLTVATPAAGVSLALAAALYGAKSVAARLERRPA